MTNEKQVTNGNENTNQFTNENDNSKLFRNETEITRGNEPKNLKKNETELQNSVEMNEEQLKTLEKAIPKYIRKGELKLPKNRKNPANYPPIETKFGTAYYDRGYYYVFDKNYKKRNPLHRLIFEDYYGIPLPETVHIHHIDRNSLNNEITNLQMLNPSDHSKQHSHTLEEMIKQSRRTNTSGYFRVCKLTDKRRGTFMWRYLYPEDGKQKAIVGKTIEQLKERVLAQGLHWQKL